MGAETPQAAGGPGSRVGRCDRYAKDSARPACWICLHVPDLAAVLPDARLHGHAVQIGLEAMPDKYVRRLLGVLREVRRVPKPNGSLYLNLGDCPTARNRCWGFHGGLLGRSTRAPGTCVTPSFGTSSRHTQRDQGSTHHPIGVRLHFIRSPRYYFDLDAIRVRKTFSP